VRENGKFYVFALGSQTKAKAFLERMKALNSK
jgi:xanthine/CO dehydrogenase XdhC/CoxF family maturation factor